ncbi:HAD-IA family hydrolase [Acinetobacter sp. HY1485]|uniref:HAD-IA family hydrolase n=1 Tax=Acinetobacter sp. HY1485 TaxID=2970918 RepID=UPI0022B97558|nr:HAD-IA family hydrolase [Acinetobacter sp. HY1485]
MNFPSQIVQNILIDLDGTLTDPKVGIHSCIRYAMEKLNQTLDKNIDLDWTIGPPLKDSFIQLLGSDKHADQALELYRERFAPIGLFENTVYPHVNTTLQTLVERGYRLYLATAKPHVYAKKILTHFGLSEYFTQIYGSELTGERTNKGELIAYILEQEQLNPKTCVMVGDRKYDILGAQQNGVATVAVTYGYGTAEEIENADVQIHSFDDLLNLSSLSNTPNTTKTAPTSA